MRTILFFFTVFTVSIIGCTSSDNNEQKSQSQQQEVFGSRGVDKNTSSSIDETVKKVIIAFKNQDTTAINQHIHPQKGLFFVQSTQGVNSQYYNYAGSSELFMDSESLGEFEINPLKYMLDYFNNVAEDEIEIVTEDLFGIDACGFDSEGFFIDSNEADIKLLTDVYTMNVAADGSEINPNELVKLGEVQNEVSKTLFIGYGEEAYTLYFTFENGKWWLSIMDLRECGL